MEPEDQAALRDQLLSLGLEKERNHALILLDAEGRVVGWYAGAEWIFGYRADEMCGQVLDCLFTEEDRNLKIPAHELEVARSDGAAEDDRWHIRKDGSRFWASGAVTALYDDQRHVGYVKVLRDRTDVKAHLDVLRKRREALFGATSRRNVLLATFVHELRNCLGPLTTAVELLRSDSDRSTESNYSLDLIQRQIDFITRLVQDLTESVRSQASTGDAHLEQVELQRVISDAVENARAAIDQRQHRLEVLMPRPPIVLYADGMRLQQVFTNLLTNAAKYTNEGGRIWIKSTVEGEEAVVRVRDTGVGIAPDMLPRVFDLFTQAPEARAMSQGGLGLGLALVKQYVELHGGTVQVRSEGNNKGSEFTVRLPLRPNASDGEAEGSLRTFGL